MPPKQLDATYRGWQYANLDVGDRFVLCGPDGIWRPDSRGGWQPRAWTGHPGMAESVPVRRRDVWIDFGAAFTFEEIYDSIRFRSARVTVQGQTVWINIANQGYDWAYNADRQCHSS